MVWPNITVSGGKDEMSKASPRPLHYEAERNFRHNYVMHCVEGGLFAGGIAFVSVDAILPAIIKDLGGPTWLISLMPQILALGFIIPPLLTAHWIERLPRVMPLIAGIGVLQRLPYLFAGLALLFLADTVPWVGVAMVAAAPFLSGIAGGLTMPAWTQLITRIIPPRRRASSAALRAVLGAVIGLGAGEIAKRALEAHSGTTGYGLIHLFGFATLMMSWIFFVRIREPNDRMALSQAPRWSLGENLRSLPRVMRGDTNFRRFVLHRILATSHYIATPFLAIHALEVTGENKAFLGSLVQAQMLGGFLGNFLAGYAGDKGGGKLPLLASRLSFLMLLVVGVTADTSAAFIAVFLLYGLSRACDLVGQQTLGLEICPLERLPTYQALMGTLSLPAMLMAAALATLLRELSTSLWPAAVAAAAGTLASLLFLFRVRDPRAL